MMIMEEGEINLEDCDRPCSELCQANCWLCRRWSRINLPGITLSNATSARRPGAVQQITSRKQFRAEKLGI